jgi:hypothetical protein
MVKPPRVRADVLVAETHQVAGEGE